MTGSVWMHADTRARDEETNAALGDGPIVTFNEDGMDEYGMDEECFVSTDQVIRWRLAERAYRKALDEMREVYTAAADLTDAMERAAEEAEDIVMAEVERDNALAHLIAEGEADREYGPREWVRYARTRYVERRRIGNSGPVFDGHTYHHRDCKVLPEDYADAPTTHVMRMNVAIETFQREETNAHRYAGASDKPPRLCKRCANPLRDAMMPTTTSEETQ